MKIFLIAVVFLAAISVLIFVGVQNAGTPVLRLADLTSGTYDAEHSGRRVQVDNGKIVRIESLSPLKFDLATSVDSPDVIHVESRRAPPDNFKEGIPASCTGTYDSGTRTFTATQISTQCPSTYNPKQDMDEIRRANADLDKAAALAP